MSEYTISELMACVMARHLRPNEVAIMGAVSAVPAAACALARATTAPGLWSIHGGSGAINPRKLIASSCDERLLDADGAMPLNEVGLLEGRGDRLDVFFAGGLQIDAYGTCNLICVGDWHNPKMRGPGTVGLPFLPRAGRIVLYTQGHNPRTLVEKVDFNSGRGNGALCVTNLCVFDFHPETKRMRLISVHPGVTVEQVLAATGFTPEMAPEITTTVPPTAEELAFLRQLDTEGVLR